jgi:hypothetical protein
MTAAPGELAIEELVEVAGVRDGGEPIADGHAVDLFVVGRLDVAARKKLEDDVAVGKNDGNKNI